MGLTLVVILGILAAAGIILVWAFLTVAKLVEKLKEAHSDYFKAVITKKYKTAGVDVIDVRVEDILGNTIAEESYASLDGVSSRLASGSIVNKWDS